MLARVLIVVVVIPVAVVLIAFAVANRMAVPLTLDPFNPSNPALSIQVPLFVLLFAALGLGVVAGGVATWLNQHHYRKLARERKRDADRLQEVVKQQTPPPPPVLHPAPESRDVVTATPVLLRP